MKGWMVLRRRIRSLVATIVLVLFVLPALPVAADEQVGSLPPVNNYTSARFDLLTTVEIGGIKLQSFGKGAVILPDRVSLWVGADTNEQLISIVQIGTTYYVNDGSGWERSESMPGNMQALPVSEQFTQLQQLANAILRVGPEPVRGISTTHYQVWLSGARLLELAGTEVTIDSSIRDLISQATIKYDFWIGDADGLLYQQNTVVMLPETTVNNQPIPASTVSTLITYYDINNPNISIQPPI